MSYQVTYAEVKIKDHPKRSVAFSKTSQRDEEEESCDNEHYENLRLPQTAETGRKCNPPRSGQQSEGGLAVQSWRKHIIYILLMICLILLAACIALGLRFFQVSEDLKIQSSHFARSTQTQSDILESKENTSKEIQLELDQVKKELKYIRGIMNTCNDSLHSAWKELNRCNLDLNTTQNKLWETEENNSHAQQKLSEAEKRLNAIKTMFDCEEADCCPKGWKLLSGRCLFFSESRNICDEGQKDCKSRNSELITTRSQYSEIQAFLRTIYNNIPFWVGLRIVKNGKWKWKWMDDQLYDGSWSTYGTDSCAVIKNGRLQRGYCSSNERWICEKPSIKIHLKEILHNVA